MTERQRDKWEANAVGFTAGGTAAVVNAWAGVDLWFIAAWTVIAGIGIALWANWRYSRHGATP